jgi:hypothetical protein
MSVEQDDQERPCLHCMMVELLDDFFAEYPAASGEPDAIDTDEVVTLPTAIWSAGSTPSWRPPTVRLARPG